MMLGLKCNTTHITEWQLKVVALMLHKMFSFFKQRSHISAETAIVPQEVNSEEKKINKKRGREFERE